MPRINHWVIHDLWRLYWHIQSLSLAYHDEPTTHLDASSEALVLEGLSRLIAGRTAIVIAHRLATISRADSILVIEGGEIVERGTHLLQRGERYAQLHQLQFRAQASVVPADGLGRSHEAGQPTSSESAW